MKSVSNLDLYETTFINIFNPRDVLDESTKVNNFGHMTPIMQNNKSYNLGLQVRSLQITGQTFFNIFIGNCEIFFSTFHVCNLN